MSWACRAGGREAGAPELANFQLDAVRQGLRMIDRHGGCFIGDVVGLGKTYIGAEMVRHSSSASRRAGTR